MSNRSNPTPHAPDAAPMNAQVGNTPKRTQREYAPHGSTTIAQRAPGGRGHPIRGIDPMAPLSASNNIGRDTPTPQVHPGACGPMYSMPGDNSVGARHTPELGDALLAEAHCNTLIGSEKPHSMTGKKGC